jgi:hypothetical protein
MYLAKHMGFAYAAGDQLRDLGAKVEDEDFGMLHDRRRLKTKKGVWCSRRLGS